MKVGDLIKLKDFDYISYMIRTIDCDEIFVGCCRSEVGKLISLDGNTIYDEEDEVIKYDEWSDPGHDIYNGLTVVVRWEEKKGWMQI